MFLSRLTLSRKPSVAALGALIAPRDEALRLDAHHRLIWTAFAGDSDARRDFLWRDEGEGRFLVLSPRPPQKAELFEKIEPKPFEPALAPGDRLSFLLRANATRTVKADRITQSGKREREHRDVVMDLMHPTPKHERAPVRMEVAQEAANAWLNGVGARSGFALEDVQARGYRVLDVPRPGKERRGLRFGILDLEGALTVQDPTLFLDKLYAGFGRAKAFGCGLMLIRRA